MSWREDVADPKEKRVLEALDNPQWSWRTLSGIKQATGLSEDEILSALRKLSEHIRVAKSLSQGVIYQLTDRSKPPREHFMEKALDYLSMGRRRIA